MKCTYDGREGKDNCDNEVPEGLRDDSTEYLYNICSFHVTVRNGNYDDDVDPLNAYH